MTDYEALGLDQPSDFQLWLWKNTEKNPYGAPVEDLLLRWQTEHGMWEIVDQSTAYQCNIGWMIRKLAECQVQSKRRKIKGANVQWVLNVALKEI